MHCLWWYQRGPGNRAQVMSVVGPGAIEAAVLASREEAHRQDEVQQALERDLEAARYAANRAWKQYDATDPENRLVTEELENRWNRALERVQELELRIAELRGQRQQKFPATAEEFENLATDLATVWNSPDADERLKKRIVRALIQEVVVDVDAQVGEILLIIHWKGGIHTKLRLPKRHRGQSSAHTAKSIVGAVSFLARICTDDVIAGALNRNGLLTGKGNRWTQERVASLRSRNKIPRYRAEKRNKNGWFNLTQAAQVLGVCARTLRIAAQRNEIDAEHPLPDGPWVFARCELESQRAKTLINRVKGRIGTPAVPTDRQPILDFSST